MVSIVPLCQIVLVYNIPGSSGSKLHRFKPPTTVRITTMLLFSKRYTLSRLAFCQTPVQRIFEADGCLKEGVNMLDTGSVACQMTDERHQLLYLISHESDTLSK